MKTLVKPAEAYAAGEGATLRQTASPLRLLVQAAGGPRQWGGKAVRLLRTLAVVVNCREVRRRLERLHRLGYIETIPTTLQLAVGGLDMLRFFIEPGAKDYYETRGINFAFHQVLRIVDDPVSMVDPVGIFSGRDVIIGHILQVVHANPVYDCQLLEMFDDGLAELEKQTAQLLDGSHPRSATIGAIVEDPEYHARLLTYVQRFRTDRGTPEMRRRAGEVRSNRDFVLAEETFGSMPPAMRYMARLPKNLPKAWHHLRTVKRIPDALCDPATVRVVNAEFASH